MPEYTVDRSGPDCKSGVLDSGGATPSSGTNCPSTPLNYAHHGRPFATLESEPYKREQGTQFPGLFAFIAQQVERILGKDEVASSNLAGGSIIWGSVVSTGIICIKNTGRRCALSSNLKETTKNISL